MNVDEAFGNLKGSFPCEAVFQGMHFQYAVKGGVVLVEVKRQEKFFYWLLVGDRFKLVHAANRSKFRKLWTIDTHLFTPSDAYPT